MLEMRYPRSPSHRHQRNLHLDAPSQIPEPYLLAMRRTPVVFGTVGGGLVLASHGLRLRARSRYDDARDAHSQSGMDKARDQANLATLVGAASQHCAGRVLDRRPRSDLAQSCSMSCC